VTLVVRSAPLVAWLRKNGLLKGKHGSSMSLGPFARAPGPFWEPFCAGSLKQTAP
jgi:hypothetical protein